MSNVRRLTNTSINEGEQVSVDTLHRPLGLDEPRDSQKEAASSRSKLRDRLEIVKDLATIASAVAIPVVLATVGYFVQQSVALQGIQKDYVGFAVSILKEDPKQQDPDLRKWAIAVMSKNSPVPFTERMKSKWEVSFPEWLFFPAASSPKSSKETELSCLIRGLSVELEAEKKGLPPTQVQKSKSDATAECMSRIKSADASK